MFLVTNVKVAASRPDVRSNEILAAHQRLGYDQNEYLRQFGLKVGSEMASVQGRVLDTPLLQYHPSSREKTSAVSKHLFKYVNDRIFN